LNYAIGGPSFFYVTGLAAGFGYNRRLIVPPVEGVAAFPLVKAARTGAKPPTNNTDVANVLSDLAGSLELQAGQNFLAIGIKFTSFKVVDSFVLLTVGFGHELEIHVLGLATAVAPAPVPGQPAKTPVAEVQMALKASFIPAEGFLGVEAQLTSGSYILSKQCRLTGGFAFYTWYEKQHKGDFVLSVGGYHPDFNKPAHYPAVPRLGLNWQVTDQLSIKGDAYFALTPAVLMAGGHLQINWASGNLRAWFNAGADFIVAWQPYHYDVRLYIDVGASYTFKFFGTHTITIDVGANLHLWGPEFSGTARIDLSIISFTVAFGADAPPPQALRWEEFNKAFLPEKREDVCTVAVKAGLLGSMDGTLGILNPKELTLAVASVIPASAGKAGRGGLVTLVQKDLPVDLLGTDASALPAPLAIASGAAHPVNHLGMPSSKANLGRFGIAPMNIGKDGAVSTLTIEITRAEGANKVQVSDQFAYRPILKALPTGLWGTSLARELKDDALIPNALVGFELTPASPAEPGATKSVACANLADAPHDVSQAFQWGPQRTFSPSKALDDGRRKHIRETLMEESIARKRKNILSSLGFKADNCVLNDDLAGEFLVAPLVEQH
jgi:hypothetical protein